ncbi:MAG: PilW family protein [Magnetococcales bacterium]|nr:PilW family protein [Magnetococcales bacterium]
MAMTQSPKPAGFSLIEVMISITIGLVILLAVISMLATSTRSQQNMEQSASIVENGHFSIQTLFDDLRHAGFYGHYYSHGLATPAALPDPCALTEASLLAAMALPVQGYESTSLTTRANVASTTCSLLTTANLKTGSDILVVRRADTDIFTGTPTINEVYLQSNVTTADIQFGNSAANVPTTTADNGAISIQKRNGATLLAADTRKYHVGVYFVAPCSVGSGSSGVCTTIDDSIPTLKRLDLTSSNGVTAMVITPVAEGVEYMKLLYGIDTSPATTDLTTGLTGDGIADSQVTIPTTVAQWRDVVSVQVHLLVRASATTTNHIDDKSYQLATITVPAFSDSYRRHVFSSEVRLVNLAGPRSLQ